MEDNTLISYDEATSSAFEKTARLSEVIRSAPTITAMVNNMPQIAAGIREIRLAQIESRKQLEVLRMHSERNLHKFDQIIRGAERRLDRQLDEMKEIRQLMRQFNIGSLSPVELSIISKLNDQLNIINSQFMYELQMLYNL